MGKKPEHALVEMRDAGIACQILGRGGQGEAVLCVCCQNSGTEACPHRGQEKIGVCQEYALDERDPSQTELRVIAFLQRTA